MVGMSDSRLRTESDAAPLCEQCGRREATASVAHSAAIDGVPSPPVKREVCTECASELMRIPADVPTYLTLQTYPAPRGVLAKARWAWRLWRFERAIRRAQS